MQPEICKGKAALVIKPHHDRCKLMRQTSVSSGKLSSKSDVFPNMIVQMSYYLLPSPETNFHLTLNKQLHLVTNSAVTHQVVRNLRNVCGCNPSRKIHHHTEFNNKKGVTEEKKCVKSWS